jgi:hypothetical protein
MNTEVKIIIEFTDSAEEYFAKQFSFELNPENELLLKKIFLEKGKHSWLALAEVMINQIKDYDEPKESRTVKPRIIHTPEGVTLNFNDLIED